MATITTLDTLKATKLTDGRKGYLIKFADGKKKFFDIGVLGEKQALKDARTLIKNSSEPETVKETKPVGVKPVVGKNPKTGTKPKTVKDVKKSSKSDDVERSSKSVAPGIRAKLKNGEVACWCTKLDDGTLRQFSVNKYGEEEALVMAIQEKLEDGAVELKEECKDFIPVEYPRLLKLLKVSKKDVYFV